MKENNFQLASIDKCKNFEFSKNTTYGLGGIAKIAYFPKTEEEAIKVLSELKSSNEKFIVLGKGSNVLVSDKFFEGAVICTSKLKGIYLNADNTIVCLSGTSVNEILKFCRENGLSGLEFLTGIPASIGGLTFMNGGACKKQIADVFVSCTVFDGKLRFFDKKLANFGYKYSTMRDISGIITSVSLKVEPSDPFIVASNIEACLQNRLSQPKGKSCGCVFKNPSGYSAGKIIEECGLKGFKFGGAHVSKQHANFIINEGGTSYDVYALIKFVKRTVYEISGVRLDEEVVYIGDFNDSFS